VCVVPSFLFPEYRYGRAGKRLRSNPESDPRTFIFPLSFFSGRRVNAWFGLHKDSL